MGIFKKQASEPKQSAEHTKKTAVAQPVEEILTPESQTKAPTVAGKVKKAVVAKGQAGDSYRILRAPQVSEKAAIAASQNVYVFQVPVTAEKISIAKAVQSLYGVTVEQVRTARGIGKPVYRGARKGRRNRWKKAFVQVKKGQSIDLYEGV